MPRRAEIAAPSRRSSSDFSQPVAPISSSYTRGLPIWWATLAAVRGRKRAAPLPTSLKIRSVPGICDHWCATSRLPEWRSSSAGPCSSHSGLEMIETPCASVHACLGFQYASTHWSDAAR